MNENEKQFKFDLGCLIDSFWQLDMQVNLDNGKWERFRF